MNPFELFAFRSWTWLFQLRRGTTSPGKLFITFTANTAFSTLTGQLASVLDDEFSRRIGRQKATTLIIWSSSAIGVGLSWLAEAPLWMLKLVTILYGMLLTGDSASITAGRVALDVASPTSFRRRHVGYWAFTISAVITATGSIILYLLRARGWANS